MNDENITDVIKKALESNPDVVLTNEHYDDRYDSMYYEIASKRGLGTPEELNKFMQSLRDDSLGPNAMEPARYYGSLVEFGCVRYKGINHYEATPEHTFEVDVYINVFPNVLLAYEGDSSVKKDHLDAMYQFREVDPRGQSAQRGAFIHGLE